MSRSIYSTKHDVIKMLTKLIFVYKRAMSHRNKYKNLSTNSLNAYTAGAKRVNVFIYHKDGQAIEWGPAD